MERIWILFKKEFKEIFLSPFIYLVAGPFCLLTGWLFFNLLLSSNQFTDKTMGTTVLIPLFGNINFIFIFLTPLLTMRSLSEEKKKHTIELLLTSRLSHLQIILGKFLALFSMVIFLLLLSLIFPITLAKLGYQNWPLVVGGYGGILLSGAAYLSLGMWSSSLTKNQAVSAVFTFCLLLGLALLTLTGNATNNFMVAQILHYLSIVYHFESFLRGGISSHNFVFFFSFISFFLYLTNLGLEARKW